MRQPEASFSQQDFDVRQSRFASFIRHVDVDPTAEDIVDPADQNDSRPLFVCMSVSGFCLFCFFVFGRKKIDEFDDSSKNMDTLKIQPQWFESEVNDSTNRYTHTHTHRAKDCSAEKICLDNGVYSVCVSEMSLRPSSFNSFFMWCNCNDDLGQLDPTKSFFSFFFHRFIVNMRRAIKMNTEKCCV